MSADDQTTGAVDKAAATMSWAGGIGLAISLLLMIYVMNVSPPARARVGFLPGFAFWFGVPSSVVLFVTGFLQRDRRRSITTMVLAMVMGVAFVVVSFFSLAVMWDGT